MTRLTQPMGVQADAALVTVHELVVGIGESETEQIEISGEIVGIWAGLSTPATCTFIVYPSDALNLNLCDQDGAEIEVTVTDSGYHQLDKPITGMMYIRVRTGTSALPVVQEDGGEMILVEVARA